jgi:hypothetical protein
MTTRDHNNRSEKRKGHTPDHNGGGEHPGHQKQDAGGGGAKGQGQGQPATPRPASSAGIRSAPLPGARALRYEGLAPILRREAEVTP